MQFYFFSHAGRKILLRFIPVSVPSAGSVLCRGQKVRATFIASSQAQLRNLDHGSDNAHLVESSLSSITDGVDGAVAFARNRLSPRRQWPDQE